jgi:hypothetical protein
VDAWRTASEGTGKRDWVTQEISPEAGDDVIGYLTVPEVLDFINKAAALPQEEKNASPEA